MRVLKLEAENFKRLKAISISPKGHLVEVSGDNGSGKSSTLDAIWAALGGKDAAPDKPVHSGEEKAEIRLILGEGGEPKLKVTRRFKIREDGPFTTDLIVESDEGARFPSPQGILDALVGELCFDPLALLDLPDKDQIKALRKFVPEVDFDRLEGLNKRDYDERTDVNRRVREAEAAAALIHVGDPVERVDVAQLEQQLAQASEHNSSLATRRAAREQAQTEIQRLETEISRLTAQRDDLVGKLSKAEALPEPIDVAQVQEALARGRGANAVADSYDERARLLEAAGLQKARAEELTAAIAARTEEARLAVQNASMPIAGLGFGDGFVTLNGEPLSQASRAQQIRASVAIAAAMNPKLRVARVLDGSLLDKKSWAALEEYAASNDLQIWIETVSAHGKAAVVIEDGGVAGAEQPAAEAPSVPDDVI